VRALIRPGSSGEDGVSATRQRLRRLGVTDIGVITASDPASELAAVAEALLGRTMLVDADLLAPEASLGQLVDDPAVRSGALVVDLPGGFADPAPPGSAQPVRSAHRRIASAGSDVHRVSGAGQAFVGALVVDSADQDAAAVALRGAADAARSSRWSADLVDLALVALVRGQVPVAAVGAVGPTLRGGTAQERGTVQGELASLDEARVLLERANRPDDGFYSTFVLRRASKPVTALALRLGLSPNQISLISLAVGFVAAACFAWGIWPARLLGAILFQASLIIDCVDGEVARFTRSFSALGAWIDAASDRVKEYAAYAGLAVGAARFGDDIWLLATLLMAVQTVRHVGDYDFSRVQRVRESWVPQRSLLDPADGGVGEAGPTLARSAQLSANSSIRWAKKVLHMPIGERWLVLSVGAVVVGPRWTLVLLGVLALVALAYTMAGRILRARRWRHPADRSGSELLRGQLDLGPLGEPLWNATLARRDPLAGAFGWAWPVGMRLVELAVVIGTVAVVAPASAPWLFAWVFVVAFHHYDLMYRALGGAMPPRWLSWFGLGWEGRTILVLVFGALGASLLTDLLKVGSPLLGLLFVVVASIQWIRHLNRRDGRVADG
jgi:Family of unknown function (DUF5941)/CDP-alcohol phosphatidyltransferase